jgi:hypothetical protein
MKTANLGEIRYAGFAAISYGTPTGSVLVTVWNY